MTLLRVCDAVTPEFLAASEDFKGGFRDVEHDVTITPRATCVHITAFGAMDASRRPSWTIPLAADRCREVRGPEGDAPDQVVTMKLFTRICALYPKMRQLFRDSTEVELNKGTPHHVVISETPEGWRIRTAEDYHANAPTKGILIPDDGAKPIVMYSSDAMIEALEGLEKFSRQEEPDLLTPVHGKAIMEYMGVHHDGYNPLEFGKEMGMGLNAFFEADFSGFTGGLLHIHPTGTSHQRLMIGFHIDGRIHKIHCFGEDYDRIPRPLEKWVLGLIDHVNEAPKGIPEKVGEPQIDPEDMILLEATLARQSCTPAQMKFQYEGRGYILQSTGIDGKFMLYWEGVTPFVRAAIPHIRISKEGLVQAVAYNGRTGRTIPEEMIPVVQAAVSEATKQAVIIDPIQAGNFISVEAVQRQKWKTAHVLESYSEAVKLMSTTDSSPVLQVRMVGPDLRPLPGEDAGALSRVFVQDLHRRVWDGEVAAITVEEREGQARLVMQSREDYYYDGEERMAWQQLGVAQMHCLRSGRAGSHYDSTYVTGALTPPGFFEAILTLTAEQASSGYLFRPARLEIFKELAKGEGLPFLVKMVDLYSKPFEEWSETELAEAFYFVGGEDADLPNEDGEPDIPALRKNELLLKNEMWKAFLGQYGRELAPILCVAKGMVNACGSRSEWNEVIRKISPAEFRAKIEGMADRDYIADQIELFLDPREHLSFGEVALASDKTWWLQKWIRSGATDEEVRAFVHHIAGSDTLAPGKQITIIHLEGEASPLPVVHACSYEVEVSFEHSGSREGQNDFTEEAFIAAVKYAMASSKGFEGDRH